MDRIAAVILVAGSLAWVAVALWCAHRDAAAERHWTDVRDVLEPYADDWAAELMADRDDREWTDWVDLGDGQRYRQVVSDTPVYDAMRREGFAPGGIFAAGAERQAVRLRAELDDPAAVAAWLGGAR